MKPNLSILRRQSSGAFTLIELLTVIAIIGTLAALLIPVVGAMARQKYIKAATAELQQLQTAIDSYHSTYGFYPPSGTNFTLNPLYYELSGTTNSAPGSFTTLDSFSTINASDISQVFGAGGGIANCTKTANNSEDTIVAKNFLSGIKANRIANLTNLTTGDQYFILVTSVGGPDLTYRPLGPNTVGVNPFRYNSVNPTNNPNSYDLWIDVSISQKTNRISNWSRQPMVLP